MYEIITENEAEEFDNFVYNHRQGHFLQTVRWRKQKPAWDWRAIVVRNTKGAPIKAAMSVLIRKIPMTPYTLMYGARGPVCELDDKESILEILDGCKVLAKQFHSYVLKVDPYVTSDQAAFKNMMSSMNFKLMPPAKNFENIQPQYKMILDIEGKTEEEILASFKQKTRYNIRVAIKKGVEIRVGSVDDCATFYKIMQETGERDQFMIRQEQYFKDILINLGDRARLFMAYTGDTPISGTIAIHNGDKMTYLYGASSNEHRNLMPNYLIQWEMIKWAIAEGCRLYDFRGISGDLDENNHLYGLYRFKSGFNAQFTELVGEYHYIFKPAAYKFIEGMMPKAKAFLKNMRKKKAKKNA